MNQGQQVVVIAQSGEKKWRFMCLNRLCTSSESPDGCGNVLGFSRQPVQGKVREIAPAADKVTRTYSVQISLIDPPEKIKLGMTANVRVEGSGGRGAIFICRCQRCCRTAISQPSGSYRITG